MSKKVTHQDFIDMISYDNHPFVKEGLILCNEYTRAKDVCYFKNKYGLLSSTFDGLKYLNKTDISMAVNKTSYFIEELKERNPKLFEEGFEVVGEYKSDRDKVLLKDKNGVLYKATPSNLKKGQNVDIRSSVDKNEFKKFFKNGLKYLGFTKEWWCSICEKKESSTLYLIECSSEDNEETFLKIGVTCHKYSKRYDCKSKLPYNKKDLLIISHKNPSIVWDIESFIKSKYSNYNPEIPFNGSLTECFSIDKKESILKDVLELNTAYLNDEATGCSVVLGGQEQPPQTIKI